MKYVTAYKIYDGWTDDSNEMCDAKDLDGVTRDELINDVTDYADGAFDAGLAPEIAAKMADMFMAERRGDYPDGNTRWFEIEDPLSEIKVPVYGDCWQAKDTETVQK